MKKKENKAGRNGCFFEVTVQSEKEMYRMVALIDT